MKIAITKRQNRNRLVCTRADGTYSISDLGAKLPHHDLAHVIVETELRMREGFFGNIARGYSFEQLAEKEIIKTLGVETWAAEILAGALGSLEAGACTLEQFPTFVNSAMARFDYDSAQTPTSTVAAHMLGEFRALFARWSALGEGATLELEFPTA